MIKTPGFVEGGQLSEEGPETDDLNDPGEESGMRGQAEVDDSRGPDENGANPDDEAEHENAGEPEEDQEESETDLDAWLPFPEAHGPDPDNGAPEPRGKEPEALLKAIAVALVVLTVYALSDLTRVKVETPAPNMKSGPFLASRSIGIDHALDTLSVRAGHSTRIHAAVRVTGISGEPSGQTQAGDGGLDLNSRPEANPDPKTSKTLVLTVFSIEDSALDHREWLEAAAGNTENPRELAFTRSGHLHKGGTDPRDLSAALGGFPSKEFFASLEKAVARIILEGNRADCIVVMEAAGPGRTLESLHPIVSRGGRVTLALLDSRGGEGSSVENPSGGAFAPSHEPFPTDPGSLELLAGGMGEVSIIKKPQDLENLVRKSSSRLRSRVSDRAIIVLNAEGRTKIEGVFGCQSVRSGGKTILKIPALSPGDAVDIAVELETWRPQPGKYPVLTLSGVWIPAGSALEIPLKAVDIYLSFTNAQKSGSMKDDGEASTDAPADPRTAGRAVSNPAENPVARAYIAGMALERLMASDMKKALDLLGDNEEQGTGAAMQEPAGSTLEANSGLARRALDAMRGAWKGGK